MSQETCQRVPQTLCSLCNILLRPVQKWHPANFNRPLPRLLPNYTQESSPEQLDRNYLCFIPLSRLCPYPSVPQNRPGSSRSFRVTVWQLVSGKVTTRRAALCFAIDKINFHSCGLPRPRSPLWLPMWQPPPKANHPKKKRAFRPSGTPASPALSSPYRPDQNRRKPRGPYHPRP
jgi:hypothetical protein